jgi:heme exporter protein C
MKVWQKSWWKILCVILVFYTIIGGFLMPVPHVEIVRETIRNMNFHVALWFAMMTILTFSVVYSIRYLRSGNQVDDDIAVETANTGILLGVLGLATGSIWARYTWNNGLEGGLEVWWANDVKLNMAVIAVLIYVAYIVLRGSFTDDQQRARVSAVYNIFAYAMLIPLLYILPRMWSSLHPGQGGNPGFNAYDLDNNLRMVFYPSIITWTLLALWISSLRIRVKVLRRKLLEKMVA